MTANTAQKLKIIVTVALYPDGVDVPEYTPTDPHNIGHITLDCTAEDHGVVFHNGQVAVPPQHPCITDTGALAFEVAAQALHDAARGEKTHVTSEEIREYNSEGKLLNIEPINGGYN